MNNWDYSTNPYEDHENDQGDYNHDIQVDPYQEQVQKQTYLRD